MSLIKTTAIIRNNYELQRLIPELMMSRYQRTDVSFMPPYAMPQTGRYAGKTTLTFAKPKMIKKKLLMT